VALLATAGASQSGLHFNAERAIDELVTSALAKHDIPGISIAIVEEGHIVDAKGFGTISLTSDRPPTADTQYRVASVSKPTTAYLDLVPSRQYAVAPLANRERSVLQVQPIISEIRRLVLVAQ
jgi:hypothetical protein